jgi:hypothetical protein
MCLSFFVGERIVRKNNDSNLGIMRKVWKILLEELKRLKRR